MLSIQTHPSQTPTPETPSPVSPSQADTETAQNKITVKLNGPVSLNEGLELPIDGLPESVQRYINAICDVYQCPREFVTAAVFATASTAVGKKIKVYEGRYFNSLVLWFVVVARSGSNKSYPMKIVTRPLRDIDCELYDGYRAELEKWRKTPEKERPANEPRCPSIVVDDCTDERRSEILFINSKPRPDNPMADKCGAIGIYPELKGMFDSRNQYQSGGTAPISKLLRLFDCENIKVDRKNGFTMLVENPFFNIIGDLQTDLLRPTFGSELFMANGLNQRFLFCVAEHIEYPKYSCNRLPDEMQKQWARTVRLLYEGIYHAPDGEHRTLFRCADGEVKLSEGAERLYKEYYDSLQVKKNCCTSDYEASVYSKLQIQVLRLAGIVHALEVAEEKGLRDDYYILRESTMAYAIRCMAYFERMALLVYGKLTEPRGGSSMTEASRGEFLKEFFRRFPKVTQAGLASLTGVTPSYISKVLRQVKSDNVPTC